MTSLKTKESPQCLGPEQSHLRMDGLYQRGFSSSSVCRHVETGWLLRSLARKLCIPLLLGDGQLWSLIVHNHKQASPCCLKPLRT